MIISFVLFVNSKQSFLPAYLLESNTGSISKPVRTKKIAHDEWIQTPFTSILVRIPFVLRFID